MRICDGLLKLKGGGDLKSMRGQNDPPNTILGTNIFRCKINDLKVLNISARKIIVFVQLLTDYLCIYLHFYAETQGLIAYTNQLQFRRKKCALESLVGS